MKLSEEITKKIRSYTGFLHSVYLIQEETDHSVDGALSELEILLPKIKQLEQQIEKMNPVMSVMMKYLINGS